MTQTPSGDPALRDPLFGELRRRHPDVTLVLLAPPALPEAAPSPAPVTEVRAFEQRVRRALDDLVGTVGVEPGATTTLWWRQGASGVHRFVARAVFTDLPTPVRSLGATYDELEDAGWRLRASSRPRPRFEGERGLLSVRAVAYPTALQVQVTSEPLVLDADTLAEPAARS
ncbi:MAG: hypothetical protein LH468_06170 [Nocardioides sp.]|nr:hypothetical protein [Nocardioides sp.]